MDQFRQIGEVVGSMKALMVLKHEILINQRQCCLLFDVFVQAFDNISDEMRQNLRLDERGTKWKALEQPMRELHGIFKEGEAYIKNCIDVKNWLGKVISLQSNRDCVEFHIHNLLSCFVVVIEAIEAAAEISGQNEDDMQKKRLALLKKYEWNDPGLFQWKYGRQYLVSREICARLDSVWHEDRWLMLEALRKKKQTKLVEELMKKLDGSYKNATTKMLPTSLLLEANDYYVKRRIGSPGSHLKEIQWLGESFALRTFYGDVEALTPEIATVMSLSHPNVLQYHCGFHDEERKEGFLVMELMSKSLDNFIKENSGQRKRMSFSTPIAVDVMLQIARGMEYLHSRNIYHGELNPSNILIKPMNSSNDGYFHAKVAGFGLSLLKSQYTFRSCPRPSGADPVIWYAPEVLAEQEQQPRGGKSVTRFSEKADVYSFGMLCFQILTGKAPFEEGERPLQGDKMVHYLMAGERPLFPYPLPKYLIHFIRKCWQTTPNARPGFASICRILRYIKKVLVINPEHGQPDCPPPLVDYCDIEAGYAKKFPFDDFGPGVSDIPFEMFSYKVVEKEKTSGNVRETRLSSDDDDHLVAIDDDLCLVPNNGAHRRSACSEIIDRNDLGTFADQRSVISEIPDSKLLLGDHIFVLSDNLLPDDTPAFVDTPDWKLLSALPPDHQSSPRLDTPTKKIPSSKTLKFSGNLERELSSKVKVQPKIVCSDSVEQRKTCPEASGKKDSATELRVRIPEASKQKPSKVTDESTRKRLLRSMKTKFGLSKIPEKKTLSASNSPENQQKPTTLSTTKPKLSFKNAIFHHNSKGKQSSNAPGKAKYQSPAASPARVTRTNSLGSQFSPFSSPMHPLKASSPARAPTTRALNASASPGFKGIKDKSRESYMSPRRPIKVQV